MLFDRFLKKTRSAVGDKATPEDLLALVRGDGDRAVRLDAVRRVTRLAHLREILADEGDLALREIAFARYRNLLAGSEQADLTVDARLSELAQVEDTRLIEHLAREGREPEIRRAAILRVTASAVLVDCALHDPLAANRGAAVARLEDRPGLEQIVRQIGKKDKAVYRTAREKLRLLNAREEEPRRIRALCSDLCERAEHLGHLQNWTQDRALLDHLDRQWAEVEAQAEPAWRGRYDSARARFLGAYEAYREANAAQIAAQEARAALRARREALISEAAGVAALDGEDQIRAARERLAAEWANLEALPEGEQRAFNARFHPHLQAAEAVVQRLAERRKCTERLRKTLTNAKKLLDEPKPLDLSQTRSLIEQGRALANDLTGDDSAARFADLATRLEARLKTQRKHAEQRLAELPARIDELETLIEAGELKKAVPLHQSLQAAVELIQASGLPKGAADAVAARLRSLSPRVRDLQHWRRWGANQHREALCEAMIALREQDLPLEAVAERLHVLQTDWKELDHSGAPGNQALWERFHRAAEAVFERVRPLLEARAAEEEAARAAREQVCKQIEDFLARVDWERVDWKRVLRAEREVLHTWSQIGPCEARDRRRLERRFHQSVRELNQRLEDERSRNQTFKQGLIARVRTLAEQPDLEAAIEETKAIQRQWHTTVPARQRDENRLWQTFRAACDAVFERRAAQHQAHRSEIQGQVAAREALCQEVMALAESQSDPKRLVAGMRELEQRWRSLESIPVPRPLVASLSRRWQQARERLEARRHSLEAAERRAGLDLLARQSALCETLEQGLLDPDAPPSPAAEAEQAWAALPTLPDPVLQGAMTARLHAALQAASDPARLDVLREEYGANAGRRKRLCLQLEVAAGVESPAALAQERLELQVSRLAERMSEGEGDSLKGAAELLHAWYLCGPAPRDPSLDARVARVRQALDAGTPAVTPLDAEPA